MHEIAAFSIRNRALIALVSIVSAVFGGIALTSLQQGLIPSVRSPALAIITDYEGTTAAVVDNDISRPIEKAVRSIEGITSSSTVSANGRSLVSLTFAVGTDLAAVEQRVEKSLSSVRVVLPNGVDPRVRTGSVDDLPIMQVAVSAPDGNAPDTALRTAITSAVEKVDGVRSATFLGGADHQLTVTPRPDDADAHGITSLDIANAIRARGGLESGGSVRADGEEVPIQIGRSVDSPETLLDTPISGRHDGGASLTLGDIADAQVQETPRSTIARVDGEEALVLSVEKAPTANTVDVSRGVTDRIDSLVEDGTVLATTTFDQAPSITNAVESTSIEGLVGLACAIIVVLVFLFSIRMTLITAVSIPLSLLLAAIAMYGAGYTLNIVTLGALTVAIGRLVDDSIVVVEAIERELSVSNDRIGAIKSAVSYVATAVVASTLTTVAVFAPLAFIGGATGALFRPFAVTASVALMASLAVSLTIVPVLSYWFISSAKIGTQPRRSHALAERMRTRAERLYRPVVQWAMRHAPATIALALLATVGAGFLVPGMATSYIAGVGQTSIHVTQRQEPGVTLAAQGEGAAEVEASLRDVPGVAAVRSTLGTTGNVLRDASLGGGSGLASYIVTLEEDASSQEVLADTREALRDVTDAGAFGVSIIEDVGFTSDLEVTVTALNRSDLEKAVRDVSRELGEVSAVAEVTDTLSPERDYVDVTVDGAVAAKHGLHESDVVAVMKGATGDQHVTDAVIDDTQVPIVVQGTTAATNAEEVAAVEVPTSAGFVPFSSLGEVVIASAPLVIQTESGLLSAKLIVTPADDNLGGTTEVVGQELDRLSLAAGVEYSIGGVAEEQSDAFAQLFFAIIVSVLIVYTIMVATFRSLVQPLLLLISVPFAAVGALIAQRLSGEAFGVASLVGVIMLIGIVVTNAIVLVDRVNQRRASGVELRQAIVEGATARFRPIVMTALATVLALTPMALGITGHAGFISRPLAIIVIGGLASSTALTLIVLPALLAVATPRAKRAEGRAPGLLARLRSSRRKPEETGVPTVVFQGRELLQDSGMYEWLVGADDSSTRALLLSPEHAPSFVLATASDARRRLERDRRKMNTRALFAVARIGTHLTSDHELAALQVIAWDAAGTLTVEESLKRIPDPEHLKVKGAIAALVSRMAGEKDQSSSSTLVADASDGSCAWVVLSDSKELAEAAVAENDSLAEGLAEARHAPS
jgi:HAE1 family hydrophobic/amphiphilic exporter-1